MVEGSILDAFSHRGRADDFTPDIAGGPGRCCQDDRGREPATKSGQAGPFSKLVPAPSQFPYFKLPHATIQSRAVCEKAQRSLVCAENLIRVAGVNKSPKLARCQTAPLATPTGLSSRTKIARLIMLAGFSLTMLLTGMERAMADFTVARRVLQVEHITIKTTKKFAEVEAALRKERSAAGPRDSGGARQWQ